jgi:hypothetical protein
MTTTTYSSWIVLRRLIQEFCWMTWRNVCYLAFSIAKLFQMRMNQNRWINLLTNTFCRKLHLTFSLKENIIFKYYVIKNKIIRLWFNSKTDVENKFHNIMKINWNIKSLFSLSSAKIGSNNARHLLKQYVQIMREFPSCGRLEVWGETKQNKDFI